VSKGKMWEIKRKNLVSVSPTEDICEACFNGKQAKLRFDKYKYKEYINRALYVIHSDVCSPITQTTNDEKLYYVICIPLQRV